MYPSIDDDNDLLAALCFDQSNGGEDPYGYIQTNEENIFSDFGSSGVNLQQPEQERVCNNIGAQFDSFNGNLQQVCSFRGENNGVVYSSSIGSAQLDLGASFSGVLQQKSHHEEVLNHRLASHVQQKEPEQVSSGVVEINSSSSVGAVKEELECVEEECSRKRRRTGSCNMPGTKACREKQRREKLNEKFVELSSVLEPGRTPKTDKSAILDDAIRLVNHLRGEAHELNETNQKLLEEIKSLKEEKNELRKEKLLLKSEKEKVEKQLNSMMAQSRSFMPPQHPSAFQPPQHPPAFQPPQHPAAFHPNEMGQMAVYPSYGYYPNMSMWPYLRDPTYDPSPAA